MPILHLQVLDGEGTPQVGVYAKATLMSSAKNPGHVDGGGTITKVVDRHSDAEGNVDFDLISNELITPAGTYWRIEIGDKRPKIANVSIPNGPGPYDIEDVLAEAPAAPTPTYLTAQQLADHRESIGDHADVDLAGAATGRALAFDVNGVLVPTDMGTQIELDAERGERIAADTAEALARSEADAEEATSREDADEALATLIDGKAPRSVEVDPVLASAIGAELRPATHQIVSAPAAGIHGFVRVGDYLFGSHRSNPGRLSRFRLDDLSDQTSLLFPADSKHNGGEALVYVEGKDRLYLLHGTSPVGGMRVLISEVNPHTMVATDFVNDTTRWAARSSSGPALTADAGFLYVLTQPSTVADDLPSEIVKYSLVDGSVVDSLTLTDSYAGHAMTHNGEHLIAAGSNTEHDIASPPWLVKVDLATLTLQNRVALTGTTYDTPTDDICIVGDFVYMGLEVAPGSSDGIVQRRRVSDLGLDTDIVVTGVGDAACFGTFWDGRYVWSLWATTPGLAVLIDPQTLEQRRFTFPTGENQPNEFATDGRRVFFAHWDSGKVSRYTLPTLTGTDFATQAELDAHAADTTAVHGIADTSAIVLTTDPRLSNARTPTSHTHSFSEVTGAATDEQIPATIARDSEVAAAIATHEADTTNVHGIASTASLAYVGQVIRSVFKAGRYFLTPGSHSTGTSTNGTAACHPIEFDGSYTLDRLAVEVTGAGSTGALIRLAIYNDNNGDPGSLLLDAGTVDAASTGQKEATISQAVARGRYWLAAVVQGAPSTTPTLRVLTGSNPAVTWTSLAFSYNGFSTSGGAVTGAFPNSFPIAGVGTPFRVNGRVAA